MNYIAVDTSGKHLTLLVKKDGKIFEYFDPACGVEHSVKVMPELEKLLLKADMSVETADFFAACVGAGSFTGIRIGVSTVKALAFAAEKPVLKITSFDTLAYNTDSDKVLAIIDAGHNGFYACAYEFGKARPAKFIMKEELALYDGYTFVSGEEIKGLKTEIVSVKDGFIKAIEEKTSEISADINSLTPLYVRKSQAEENR